MAYNIELRKPECIGCGACASVAEKFFEMNDQEGKAHLKDSTINSEVEMKEIEDSDLGIAKEAAEVCPVNIIHIKDQKGNKLI